MCNDHGYCYREMPNEDSKILVPAIIYADIECLLKKIHSCRNNLEKLYIKKKTKHTPFGYSLFTNCSFDATKKKLGCYKAKTV